MALYPLQITALHSRDFDGDYFFPEHRQVRHQFFCVLEGRVHYGVESTEYTLNSRQLVISAAGLRRTPSARSPKGKTLVVGFVSPWPELGRPEGTLFELSDSVLSDAQQLAAGDYSPQDPIASILFHRVLLGLLGEGWFKRLGKGVASLEAQQKAEGAFLVAQVEAIMQANLERPLQLGDFVELSGVSQAHLRRLFQRHRGVPPCARFRNMRLEHAHRMLQSSQILVSDLAMDLGFSSSQHFAMAFKKHFGYPPTEAVKQPKYDPVEFTE